MKRKSRKNISVRKRLRLTIGGITVAMGVADAKLAQELRDKYRTFLAAGKDRTRYTIRVTTNARLRANGTIRVECRQRTRWINGGEFQGRLSPESKTAQVTLRPHPTVVDAFLRVFYSLILTEHQGFLIHAAALSDKKKGVLFSGPSSSGKTTVARHAQDFQVLNDELALVRRTPEGFFVYGTPFHGEYAGPLQNSRVGLAAMCFLNKKQPALMRPVSSTGALVLLLENIFFFDNQPRAGQLLLALCAQAATQLAAYQVNTGRGKNLRRLFYGVSKSSSGT